jgi:hypothetical protein
MARADRNVDLHRFLAVADGGIRAQRRKLPSVGVEPLELLLHPTLTQMDGDVDSPEDLGPRG